MTAADQAAVDRDVRAFVASVAQNVTSEGPAAWRRFFSESPSFYMASEGRLQFPNSQSAAAAIQDLTRIIRRIELQWGNDLRVDPFSREMAGVAVPYREIREDTSGVRVDESGYFTGTVELRGGRWQFRNAHWSVIVPAPAVR